MARDDEPSGDNKSRGQASTSNDGNAVGAGNPGAAPPAQRSRTACVNCRTTKQKCDGPSRIPCRRCELYNLECYYSESGTGRGAKRKAADDASGAEAPIPKPATVTSDVANSILERLEELAGRTRSIEEQLRATPAPATSRAVVLRGDTFGLPDTTATASNARLGNPVSTIVESFQTMDDTSSYGSNYAPSDLSGYPCSPLSPDAVSRGLITVEQAQRYFAFFVERCRYWVHGFVPSQLSDAMQTRATCPLLFGAVCCVSSFFLDSGNGESGLQLYLSLVSLVNETLAPIIMSPRPSELDDGFVLGIALSIIWKSPRIERSNMDVSHWARMQTLSKLNNSTTYFLAGIATRAARVNKLNDTPNDFMKGDKTPKTMARCRLWLWMCFVDAHGCMQNGRGPSIDITDSLKVTRAFAAIGEHPTDIEMCALLEVSSVYRTFHGQSQDDRTNLQALHRANTDLDTIANYWLTKYPRLNYEGAFLTQFIAPFHRLVINADIYRSWSLRNATAQQGNSADAPPVLNHEEAKYLSKAVDAAQTILLNLGLSARAEGGRRVGHFEEPQYWKDGYPVYRPMEPDVDHARHIRTAVDTVICVIIVFSAMFLAKIRAANLIRCSLEVVTPTDPIKPWDHDARGQVAIYSKFFRIIELASDFLEMVAPNPAHPCLTQSRVLRGLLASATTYVNRQDQTLNGQKIEQSDQMRQHGQPQLPHQLQLGQGMAGQANMIGHGQQLQQQQPQPTLPKYPHTVIGHQTVDHSPDSPIAQPPVPSDTFNAMGSMDPNFNDVLTGIGQPGNPLVASFLGGDEWSMLMSSLGLKPN